MDITFDKSVSPVSELTHAYTDFFLDRCDKGFVHSDDDLIIGSVRLDAPNQKYWHCLTYNQIYSKFYRLFNMVFRSARFWNLFGYVDIYRRGPIYSLMEASNSYWNEFARRQLHDYYEFLESCSDEQRAFLFSRSIHNEVKNSTKDVKKVYSYDYELIDKFLSVLTADNRKACVDKVKHKEFNDLSGLLLNN